MSNFWPILLIYSDNLVNLTYGKIVFLWTAVLKSIVMHSQPLLIPIIIICLLSPKFDLVCIIINTLFYRKFLDFFIYCFLYSNIIQSVTSILLFSVMENSKVVCESDSGVQKLDLSVQNNQGNTPLHQIVAKTYPHKTREEVQKLEEKDIQNLKLLLKFHPDVNLQNAEGYTCVHLAFKNKRSDALVQVLLDHGGECDYNFTDREGCTALYHAVSPISYKFEGSSLKYSNFNFKFRDGSIIKHLVEKGAKVDIAAHNGYSPLLLAVVMQKTDYVSVMLETFLSNSSVDSLEQTINTSFFTAIFTPKGIHTMTIIYPPKEYYHMTPLHIAVYDENKEMAQLLVKAGANVNAVNGNKDNALHMIIRSEVSPGRHATGEQTKIAKFLLDSGIDINSINKSGNTALHLAISKDKQEIVSYIIEKGLATL